MSSTENNLPSGKLNPDGPKTESQNDMINSDQPKKTEDIITTKKEIKYAESPYRWFFLVAYCLSGFVNQVQWVCFSAILTDFSEN